MTRRLLPGIFMGSHAIAEGLLTRRQLRERSYRRLVQGVYADPALPFDHRRRCEGVALLLPEGAAIGRHSAAAWCSRTTVVLNARSGHRVITQESGADDV